MIGVNIDNLETLIKKNNMYLNDIKNNQKKVINSVNELSSCYTGSSLNYLFSEPKKEVNKIKTISRVIENYSDVMRNVKISYQKQDLNLQTQVNRINSKIQ